MFEMLGLAVFAGVVYLFLVVVPSVVEKLSSEEFKKSYFSHLGDMSVNSYGK